MNRELTPNKNPQKLGVVVPKFRTRLFNFNNKVFPDDNPANIIVIAFIGVIICFVVQVLFFPSEKAEIEKQQRLLHELKVKKSDIEYKERMEREIKELQEYLAIQNKK